MKALVTAEGQVTIPKSPREQYGIEPGVEVDFAASEDGIRLRKVAPRGPSQAALGCLKEELAGRSVVEWLNVLRGPAELTPVRAGRRHSRSL